MWKSEENKVLKIIKKKKNVDFLKQSKKLINLKRKDLSAASHIQNLIKARNKV